MGSGLILFVIVGIWLAVLVPMGLRSHEGAEPSRSAERLSSAMRVLSRRSGREDSAGDTLQEAAASGSTVEPGRVRQDGARLGAARVGSVRAGTFVSVGPWGAALARDLLRALGQVLRLLGRLLGVLGGVRRRIGLRASLGLARRRPTAAARRRRVLLGLVLAAGGCLAAGLLLPQPLLLVSAAVLGAVGLLFLARWRRMARRAHALHVDGSHGHGDHEVRRPLTRDGDSEVHLRAAARGSEPPPVRARRSTSHGAVARRTEATPAPVRRPVGAAAGSSSVRASLAGAAFPTPAPPQSTDATADGSGTRQVTGRDRDTSRDEDAVAAATAFAQPAVAAPRVPLADAVRSDAVHPEAVHPDPTYDEPVGRHRPAAALGMPWQPVPVPPPLYVGKAAAAPKPRPAREPLPQVSTDDAALVDPGSGRDVHAAAAHRRAVGDW